MGINLQTMDIEGEEEGEFFIETSVKNNEDGLQGCLLAVYGAAQP